jgi:hypothetical protein
LVRAGAVVLEMSKHRRRLAYYSIAAPFVATAVLVGVAVAAAFALTVWAMQLYIFAMDWLHDALLR